MSEFKLVPVETIRHAIDALELYASDTLAGTHSAGELRMLLVDAPAVQGEPVAHLRRDQLQQIKTRGPVVGEISPSPRGDMVAVYAASQPAEQKPMTDVAKLAARLSKVIRDLESGFVACERCGDQEDTATLDCMPELTAIRNALAAHCSQGGE